jgi:PIN domain nuclease of toxin-antitoxin system
VRLLLDTHTVLWATTGDPQLSPAARAALLDSGNALFFSTASAWEIVIKHATGKLSLPMPPARFVRQAIANGGYAVLEANLDHTLGVAALPAIHKDPFDRLLVSQALHEGLTILGDDALVAQYGAPMHW